MEQTTEPEQKKSWRDGLIINSSNNAFMDRLNAVRGILTEEYINVLIPFLIFVLVVSMVVFGYFWKQMYLMKVVLVVVVILLALLMAARHFWYPKEWPKTPQKGTKKEEKEPGIMESIQDVIPSSTDYEANMEKAFKL